MSPSFRLTPWFSATGLGPAAFLIGKKEHGRNKRCSWDLGIFDVFAK